MSDACPFNFVANAAVDVLNRLSLRIRLMLAAGLVLLVGIGVVAGLAQAWILLLLGGVLLLLWMAAMAAERKSSFVATMSHELRAPMHIILNYSRLVDELGDLNDMQKTSLNNVLQSANHLLAVINDVLDMAKIEAGQLDLHLQSLDLKPLLLEMETSAKGLMGQKSLFFAIEAPESIPPVLADVVRVRQILLNLISNAVRFTDEGGLTLLVQPKGKMLEIGVRDTGAGIPPEKQAVIFERFQQGKDRRGGTGLGLTITRDLVQMMGGQIRVTSTEGQGSTFYFTLPLV